MALDGHNFCPQNECIRSDSSWSLCFYGGLIWLSQGDDDDDGGGGGGSWGMRDMQQ